jgi:futalosine hydrolase
MNMNCLLVAATTKEIRLFLEYYRQSDRSRDIDIMITGVGLAAATYSITRQVGTKKPDLIIQAGIAGCFDKNLPLGSVVVVKREYIADQFVMEKRKVKTVFDLGLVGPNQSPYRAGGLVNPHNGIIRQCGLKAVNAVSVNQVTTRRATIDWYREKYKPITESMEGAALHFVAISENIPFLQLRGVSNYIGERNKAKWNFADSIGNLNRELIRIVDNLYP